MTLADIAAAAKVEGLDVVGACHPGDGADATLVLLGPGGPAMWAAFAEAAEAQDGRPDPLDRWSARVIGGLATSFGATAHFPFGGPPYAPFITWATAAEGARPSPVGMLVSPQRGLWASYRGALGFAATLDLGHGRPPENPCAGCPRPCLTACPAAAFADGRYDVARCVAHVTGPDGAPCRTGCLVRSACPAGATLNLPEAQRQFHMAAFLKAHS